jgi:hypothetical protein
VKIARGQPDQHCDFAGVDQHFGQAGLRLVELLTFTFENGGGVVDEGDSRDGRVTFDGANNEH